MSEINTIQGNAGVLKSSKISTSKQPEIENNNSKIDQELDRGNRPKGVKQILQDNIRDVSDDDLVSYETTLDVANKLQSRLDELAEDQHKVAIHTDKESKQFIIEIQDPEGKVVKQFPQEKILNLHQKMDDLPGMVIDEMI